MHNTASSTLFCPTDLTHDFSRGKMFKVRTLEIDRLANTGLLVTLRV